MSHAHSRIPDTGLEPRWVRQAAPAAAEVATPVRAERAVQGFTYEGQSYELTVIRDEGGWDSLEGDWDRLLLDTPGRTVFQSYTYQRLWWRHFGRGRQLLILVIAQEGIIQGIAPLQVQAMQFLGRHRELGFVGSRWEVDRPVFLFPRDRERLLRLLAHLLVRRVDGWDLCQLHEQIDDADVLATLTRAFTAEGCLVGLSDDSACPYLSLEGDWQTFLAGKTQKFRKNLKAAGRKLKEAGRFEYRVHHAAPAVLKQLQAYRDLESRSWKQDEGVGVSRSDAYFAFYQDVAAAFAETGSFIVRTLALDGHVIAGTFGLRFAGTYYSLQIAHDRAYDRSSPGTYLESLEIEDCFRGGDREYEFLGGFLTNKSRWTETFRHTTQLHVFRRRPALILWYWLYFRIKPWVRRARLALRRPSSP